MRKIERIPSTKSRAYFLTMTTFQTIGKKFISWFHEDGTEEDRRHARVAALIVEQLTNPSSLPEDDPRHPFNRYTHEHRLGRLCKDLRHSLQQEGLQSLRYHFFNEDGIWAEEVDWLLLAYGDYTEGDPNWDGPWHGLEADEIP